MAELFEYLKGNWDQLALLATVGLVLLTYWKSRSVWKARDFLGRINFSLNYIQDNTLKIRTLARKQHRRDTAEQQPRATHGG